MERKGVLQSYFTAFQKKENTQKENSQNISRHSNTMSDKSIYQQVNHFKKGDECKRGRNQQSSKTQKRTIYENNKYKRQNTRRKISRELFSVKSCWRSENVVASAVWKIQQLYLPHSLVALLLAKMRLIIREAWKKKYFQNLLLSGE